MNLLHWLILIAIVVGFLFLISKKKKMERKLELIKASGEVAQFSNDTQSIIWWIFGTTAWGLVSMSLILWLFNDLF